jgi:hypothetical protein
MTAVFLLICFLLTSIHFADAQPAGKVARIGFLDISNASGMAGLLEAFRHELNKLGWIEGKKYHYRIPICRREN